jgi:ABC-type Zn uptake system ZnuABC Zn-binding protein ZnuA
MRRAWLVLGWVAGLAGLAVVGCTPAPDPWKGEPEKPRVVVTIAPLSSFARAVLGDRGALRCLCTTTGPHHYQADSKDARLLTKAHVFFAVGLKLDDVFADAIQGQARNPKLRYVKLGERFPTSKLLMLKEEEHDHDQEHGHAEHAHQHGKHDPHLWLGIPEAVFVVKEMAKELSAADPDEADTYQKNAADYVKRLEKLQADGKAMLQGKKSKRIICFHDSFGYFARSFDLKIAEAIEMSPGDEASPGHRRKLVKLCLDKSKPIGAITVEPQYPEASAEVIQKELKARGVTVPLVKVDPLETAEPKELEKEGGDWYLARQRKNLKALADRLP